MSYSDTFGTDDVSDMASLTHKPKWVKKENRIGFKRVKKMEFRN